MGKEREGYFMRKYFIKIFATASAADKYYLQCD